MWSQNKRIRGNYNEEGKFQLGTQEKSAPSTGKNRRKRLKKGRIIKAVPGTNKQSQST